MGVRDAWLRILTWCQENASATAQTIRPPAAGSEISEAESSTSGTWPTDLRDWYLLADGVEPTPNGCVLPSFCPLPLHAVTETWLRKHSRSSGVQAPRQKGPRLAVLDAIERSLPPLPYLDTQDYPQDPDVAGTASGIFLPSFIPIAEDQSASFLFVDTRLGPNSGCVTGWDKLDADAEGPLWPSVSAMLAELADGLENGRPVGGWQPFVEDGSLDWDVADDEYTLSRRQRGR